MGGAAPTPEESAGWAGRVEVYKCNEVRHFHLERVSDFTVRRQTLSDQGETFNVWPFDSVGR